jgi:hypothetical protein
MLLEQWGVPYEAALPLSYVTPRLEYAFLMDVKTASFDICMKIKAFQLICSGDSAKSSVITPQIIVACSQCKSLLVDRSRETIPPSIDLTDEREESQHTLKRTRTSL